MGVAFVHLSDIHFGQEKRQGEHITNQDARNQLIEDAASIVAGLSNGKASGIILTGDIAYAGKTHEYQAAGKWLDELASKVGCGVADIQMVPGNHDIDLDRIKGGTAMMLDAIRAGGEAVLDSFLLEEADRQVLYLRFEAYRHFADAYQCPLDCTGNNSADRTVDLVKGRAIRFVRLNSALICDKKPNEHGKLLLGAGQRVMKAAAGEELVVLTHHPLSWFADSAETMKFLRGRARVFISGHEHLAAVEVEKVEVGRDLMMLAAGATTPDRIDEGHTYAYNVIEFDWDEAEDALAVTLYPRIWNDNDKCFEADDTGQGRPHTRTVLGSPNFRKAEKPAKQELAEKQSNTEPMRVEIILPPEDVVTEKQVNEAEYQNLYLRFFRDIDSSDRLRILVELGAVPADFKGDFTHETEGKLLRSMVRANRFDELRTKVEHLLDNRKIN